MLGRPRSCPEIIADLNSLTKTEVAYEGKRFIVRSAPRPAAGPSCVRQHRLTVRDLTPAQPEMWCQAGPAVWIAPSSLRDC